MSPVSQVILIVLLLCASPTWPYSRSRGCRPGGLAGTTLLVGVILVLAGHL